MLNKERQYSSIYFPEGLVKEREQTWDALQNIDCNFSKIIQIFLWQLKGLSRFIIKQNKNFRHYEWILVIRDKRSEETYTCKGTSYEKGKNKEV